MIETVVARSWSEARIGAFRLCPRLYRMKWDRVPLGSESGSPDAARLSRRLGRMTDLRTLVREVVHALIVESLASARAGDAAAVDSEIALHRLRAVWRRAREHSANGAASGDGAPRRHRPVFEVFYGEEGSALREVAERAPACVAAWQRSALFERLVEAPADELLWLGTEAAAEERTPFVTEGVRIHGAPDLVWRPGGGDVEIVEWRTGFEAPDDRGRLAVAALWTVAMLGADPASLAARVVHLPEDAREDPRALEESDLRVAADRVRADVRDLESAFGTPDPNGATADSIPRLDDPSECRRCHFRAACWPDGC